MRRKDIVIAAAVLAAGVAVSVGLLAALRDDAPSAPAGFPTGPQNVQALVEEQVRGAIERARPSWIERCWQPSVARTPEPTSISFIYDSTFDAQGVQVTRSFREMRAATRPDVMACLGEDPLGIRVAPPGTSVRVELDVSLP